MKQLRRRDITIHFRWIHPAEVLRVYRKEARKKGRKEGREGGRVTGPMPKTAQGAFSILIQSLVPSRPDSAPYGQRIIVGHRSLYQLVL